MIYKAARARFRLDELTVGTFNVLTEAVNSVYGIGHIDTLPRTCVAKVCYVIELRETKRDGTSEIVASGYHVYFSVDNSGVKGRIGQQEVGRAINEAITKNDGKDGIAIKCISPRLLKVPTSTVLIFVTFVVAYTPTEEAPEGKNTIYMVALNSTVPSVPARERVFFLTHENVRTGKRGEGSEEAGCKVLGAYDQDVLNENDKPLLGFAENNKLALLKLFFCNLKRGVSYTFQSAMHSKRQLRLDHILTEQMERRFICCVSVRRPPWKARESDHNLVYANVRILCRSARNRRKRHSTKDPKMTDLSQLMADPNVRCQVENAMVAALPPILDRICTSDIATDMVDVVLSTATELALLSKRPCGGGARVLG